VEQPIEQPLGGDLRVGQLDVLDRAGQRLGLGPGVVGLDSVRLGAFRRVAGVEIAGPRPV